MREERLNSPGLKIALSNQRTRGREGERYGVREGRHDLKAKTQRAIAFYIMTFSM